MKHSTFEITFYPNESDLKREAADKTVADKNLPARYQVTAVYRPWDTLSATVETGQFEYTPAELEPLAGNAVRYGQYLGEKLFHDPVAGLFQTALAGNQDSLHCLLQLESKSLRGIRWERLRGPLARGPNGWSYLGMTSRTPLAVHVAGGVRRRFPPRGFSAFRSLLVVASPNRAWDAPAFDVPDTVSEVKAGMDDKVVTVLARTDGAKGKPTLAELVEQLTQNSFTALHVVAHCAYQASTGFYLILEDNDGNAAQVPVSTLISELGKLRDDKLPYLTFLACCSSAAWDDDDAEMIQSHQNCLYQGAFAQTMVREAGLPAVIGMADLITPETAGKLAKVFYRQLREHGLPDVALAEARAGLGHERDILAPLLISQLGALPMFDGTIDTVPTDPTVIANGLQVLEKALEIRAPILLEKGDEGGAAAKKYHAAVAATMPPRPDDLVWQLALKDLNSIADECLSSATDKASFSGICAGKTIPDYDPDCPFTGMKPIDFDSRRYFKAREKLTGDLVNLLKADEVLAVVGPSGSGKSSLILAGVLPLFGLRDNKEFGLCAPGLDPLAALDKALAAPLSPASPLVVDQFEELFTHYMPEQTRDDFLARLRTEKARRRVLITLRSEFRDRLRNTWLWPFVPDPEDTTKARLGAAEVAAMSAEDLGKAMLEQAAEAGLQFDEGLIDEIREAIDGEPGRMPLLQHTLLELWKRRHGIHLLRAEYKALGGVRQAVSRTADTFVTKVLTKADDRRRVMDLFLRLVRVADESDITNQTRRRTHIAELIPAGEDPGKDYDLRLMFDLKDVHGVPTEDKNRVIVAEVNGLLHFRFFEAAGKIIVDTNEHGLPAQTGPLNTLRDKIKKLRPLHELTGSEKAEVVRVATSIVGHTPGKTQELLEELKKRYLVITAGAEAEVAHEALIQHWDTLSQWVKKYHADLQVRQTLAVDSSDWEKRGRPTDGLVHRGGKLLDAKRRLLNHSELRLNQTEVDYLDACERQQRREKRQLKGAIVAACLALLGVIVAIGWANKINWDATLQEKQHLKDMADAEKKRADDVAKERDAKEEQRKKAENLATVARKAFTQSLERVGHAPLAAMSREEQVPKQLLNDALVFFRAYQNELDENPKGRFESAQTRRWIGDVLQLLGQNDEAEIAYAAAETLLTPSNKDDEQSPDELLELAQLHNNMGVLNQTKDKDPAAKERFDHSIAIYRKLIARFPKEPEYRLRLAQVLSNQLAGLLQSDKDRVAEAKAAYEEADQILEQLVRELPTKRSYRREWAKNHETWAEVFDDDSEAKKKKEHYLRALTLYDELAKEDVNDLNGRDDQVSVRDSLGLFLLDLNQLHDAEHYLRESRDLTKQLSKRFKSVADYGDVLKAANENLRAVALAYQEESLDYETEKKWKKAEESMRHSISLLTELACESVGIPNIRRDVVNAYISLASVFAHEEKLDDAENALREARQTLKRLSDQAKNDPVLLMALRDRFRELAVAHGLKGASLLQNGNAEEALEPFRKMIGVLEEIRKEVDTDDQVLKDLIGARDRFAGALFQAGVKQKERGNPEPARLRQQEAIKEYQKALNELELLNRTRAKSTAAEAENQVGAVTSRLGQALVAMDQVKEGCQQLRLALDHFAKAARLEKTNSLYSENYRSCARYLGTVLGNQSKHEELARLANDMRHDFPESGNIALLAGEAWALSVKLVSTNTGIPEAERKRLAENYTVSAVGALRDWARFSYDVPKIPLDPQVLKMYQGFAPILNREEFKKFIEDREKLYNGTQPKEPTTKH